MSTAISLRCSIASRQHRTGRRTTLSAPESPTKSAASLTHGNRLSEALQAALSDAGIPPAADLAASLCAADPEKALEDLLFPATRSTLALLDPRHQEFADTWNDAKAALAWLSLLAVDGASLGLAQRNALADGQLSFEIVVETPLGVELVSSRHRQIAICAH